VELAGDLRDAETKAERDASAALDEAMVARRGSVIQSTRARQSLEAANAVVEEAGEAAEEVSRERRLLQAQQRHAAMERRLAAEAKHRYELEMKRATQAQLQAEEQRQKALSEKLALETKEDLAFAQVAKEKEEAEKERQHHYEAAAAMKQKTIEAQAVAELASRERVAAEHEKAQATLWKRQAGAAEASATTFSYITWGLMFLFGLGFLALSAEFGSCARVAKWEAMGLRPIRLLHDAVHILTVLRCRRIDANSDKLNLTMPVACPQLPSSCEGLVTPEVASLIQEPADVIVASSSASPPENLVCCADDVGTSAQVANLDDDMPASIEVHDDISEV
jgi:chemotaxis protein histidine kinase CheA